MNTESLRFSPLVDLATAAVVYLGCVALIARLRRTHHVPLQQFFRGAVLLALMFGVVCWLGFLIDFSVGLTLVALLALICGISFSVSPVILMGVVFEFLLGIPLHNQSFAPPPTDHSALKQQSKDFIGCKGVSCCPLKPFGEVELAGQLFEATSEGGKFIAAGQPVIVTAVKGGTLVVAVPPSEG